MIFGVLFVYIKKLGSTNGMVGGLESPVVWIPIDLGFDKDFKQQVWLPCRFPKISHVDASKKSMNSSHL